MVIEPKKKRRKNPVTALSKGLEEDLRRQGYAASTIWKQRRLLNDLIGWLQGQSSRWAICPWRRSIGSWLTAVPLACAN